MWSWLRLHRNELVFLLLLALLSIVPGIWIRPTTQVRAVYIHPGWNLPIDQTSEMTFQQIAHSGINTIFVDVYYPTGLGEGRFLAEKKKAWIGGSREPEFLSVFSLEETMNRAKKFSISVHVTINCFGQLPALDPTSELHRVHLLDVVAYVLSSFPSVDGIHLDYIRYMHEYGLAAKGNTLPVTTLMRGVRDIVQTKMLSAAVFAAGDQNEYEVARYLTGQDYAEMSQYLDFMCPMAYHLSAGKELGWVRQVARFNRNISRKECQICPVLQAYFQFETRINISGEATWLNATILGPRFEVPTSAALVFKVSWENRENSFSLIARNPFSQEVFVDRSRSTGVESTSETFTVAADTVGIWTTELKTHSLSKNDLVTVQISDVNEELPGYRVIWDAVSLVVCETGGFCIYALNNLSHEEMRAIHEAITASLCRYTYLEIVYVKVTLVISAIESYPSPFPSR